MNDDTIFTTGIDNDSILSATTSESFVVEDPMKKTLSDYVEISILTLCFTIGAPLNLISFYKLFRSFKRFTYGSISSRITNSNNSQINLLRLHLNIADLMTIFIYTTSQIGWLSTSQWLGGDVLCRIIKFFHTFVFYLTSFIIVSIAIDRVYGAYKLSSFKASKRAFKRCKKMIIIAWILAAILSLPQSYIFRLVEPPNMKGFLQCATIWMAERSFLEEKSRNPNLSENEQKILYFKHENTFKWETAYNICHLLFVFWIPVFVIISSYMSILCILNHISRQRDDFYEEIKIKPTILSMFYPFRMNSNSKTIEKNSTSIGNSGESEPFSSSSTTNFSKQCNENNHCNNNIENINLHVNLLNKNTENEKRKDSTKSCIQATESLKLIENRSSDRIYTPKKEFKRSESEHIKTTFVNLPTTTKSGANTPVMNGRDRSYSKVGPLALQTIAIARQKTKRQAALILIAYLTLWTPYNVLTIVNIFIPQDYRGSLLNQIMVIIPFTNSLIVITAIINPLIYGVFDKSS